jgi:hypothetical protein
VPGRPASRPTRGQDRERSRGGRPRWPDYRVQAGTVRPGGPRRLAPWPRAAPRARAAPRLPVAPRGLTARRGWGWFHVKHPASAASPGSPNGGLSPARRPQAQARARARRQQSCAWHQSARTSRLPQVRAQARRARPRDHRLEPERTPEDRCPRAIPAPAVKPSRAPFPASVSGPLVTLHRYRSPGREGAAARGEDLVSPAGCRPRHPPAPRPRAPGRPSPTPAAWPAATRSQHPLSTALPEQPRPSATARLQQPALHRRAPALLTDTPSYWPAPAQQPAHPADSHRPGSQREHRSAPPRHRGRQQSPAQPIGTSPATSAPPATNALHRRAHPWAIGTPLGRHRPTPQQPARQQPTPARRRAHATGASGLLSRPRRRGRRGGLLVPPSTWPTRVIPSVGHRRSV